MCEKTAFELRFSMLGPVEVWRAGVRCELGPPQRRVLLVRLLAADGEPVSLDRLCEDLWRGSPPAGAISALHAHISRLRGALEPPRTGRAAARNLARGPLGYRLRVPQGALDTHCFEAEWRPPADCWPRGTPRPLGAG